MLNRRWKNALDVVDYALQPIVNVHTGFCFAVEALIRNTEQAGFTSIQHFFDAAFEDGVLYEIDLVLRRKAAERFIQIPYYRDLKLFFNLDNRLINMPDYCDSNTPGILESMGIAPSAVTFEISERHQWVQQQGTLNIFQHYRRQTCQVALDDFGCGFSGLQLLYRSEPDYVKIDRFFISEICKDARKKLFVASIVNLAHTLSILVVAEGVESSSEFYACKEIGCDYIQGYLVSRPVSDPKSILSIYESVRTWNQEDKRDQPNDIQLIKSQCKWVKFVRYPQHNLEDVFEYFRKNKQEYLVPVVNDIDEPLGIIHERDLKEYVYSPFGRDLLKNRFNENSLFSFLTRVPCAEITKPLEEILQAYSFTQESQECVFITENGKYRGLLTAKTLLNALNEKNLAVARDLNPLTRLPGNNSINQYIGAILASEFGSYTFVYFDFDHFKPFNDVYGFRTGDRAIHLFAESLTRFQATHKVFIGHIGGDDFFIGSEEYPLAFFQATIPALLDSFLETVEQLFSPEHRKKRCYRAKDRFGEERCFPLLSVSAGVLHIEDPRHTVSEREFSLAMAKVKKTAKESKNRISLLSLSPLGETLADFPDPQGVCI